VVWANEDLIAAIWKIAGRQSLGVVFQIDVEVVDIEGNSDELAELGR
jgi:hypothetical protein